MKKLLLLLTAILMAFSGFAQDTTEEPALGSEQNPFGEKSPWIFKIQRTQPQAETLFYYMSETTAKNGSDIVYSISLDVQNVDDPKQSCYYFTAIYVDETGKQTSYAYGSRYDLPIGGDSEKIVVAAWGTKFATFSNKPYIIGDSNWTGLAYVPSSKDGSKTEVYLNSTTNAYKSLYTINTGASTDQYLAGNAAASFANSNSLTKSCLNKATIDYAYGSISFEPVQSVVLDIQNVRPFVAPININVPTGVKVFTYAAYDNGVLSVEQLDVEIIPANTPVILKANVSGSYVFSFADSEFKYNEETSPRTFLLDTQYESYPFYGVHGVHYVPENGYIFDGEKFVKANSTDIVTALNCYVMTDDEVESISIEFPVELPERIYVHFTDENGSHSSTHTNYLTYNEDGYYSNTLDFSTNTHFVLADANFGEEIPVNKQWNELGDNATIFHDGGSDIAPLTEDKTWTIASISAQKATSDNVTPFIVEGKKKYKLEYTPGNGDTPAVLYAVENGLTSISEISIDNCTPADNRIFNIYGQQVDETYKGLVIKNGKKIFVR